MMIDTAFLFFLVCAVIFVGMLIAIYLTNPGPDDDDHNYR